MEPFGLALLDYIRGNTTETITLERDDSYSEEMPISIFFRKPSEYYPHEHTAIDLCSGRILDIGAGTGIHRKIFETLIRKKHKSGLCSPIELTQ